MSIFGLDHETETLEARVESKPANSTGEGLDRKIRKRFWTPRTIVMAAGIVAFIALVGFGLSRTAGGSRLNVDRDKLTISTVQEGAFQEYISVTGTVTPANTVYLDAVEGGRIEEVFAREGARIQKGDPILRLSNSNLQLSLLNNEAALTEQENLIQSARFQMEQNALHLRQQLAEMDYNIRRLDRENRRNEELHRKALISDQEYEKTNDELEYWQGKRELTRQGYRQDSLAQAARMQQIQEAIGRMRQTFGLLQQNLENLVVRAPVSGQLTALDAEIGQLRSAGSRFGQIDVQDGGFKVRAAIDEYYITRVQVGQTASTQAIAGKEYRMEVRRVYPQVKDGRFDVDLEFTGAVPQEIRRGQTIRFNLQLGDPGRALLLPRGGFYQTTGGNWAYVLDASGKEAVRRNIRLGRQNPDFYEVEEGLRAGDRVVTSSYETFGEVQRLAF